MHQNIISRMGLMKKSNFWVTKRLLKWNVRWKMSIQQLSWYIINNRATKNVLLEGIFYKWKLTFELNIELNSDWILWNYKLNTYKVAGDSWSWIVVFGSIATETHWPRIESVWIGRYLQVEIRMQFWNDDLNDGLIQGSSKLNSQHKIIH